MRIIVRSTAEQTEEWLLKPASASVDVHFTNNDFNEGLDNEADAWVDLLFDDDSPVILNTTKPVFANAVSHVLNELPENYIRINGWPGFLQRPVIEIASADINKKNVDLILRSLNRNYTFAPDIPGMIAARSISMIINEAYFALGDNVSTKEEIDIAMKLGTNYPFGPFEWSKKIGLHKIYLLLKKLAVEDTRYTTAPLLEKEALQTFIIQ